MLVHTGCRLPFMKQYIVLLACLFCVVVAGCSGSRRSTDTRPELPDSFPYQSASQILDYLHPRPDTLGAFKAKASLALRTPQQKANVTANLHHRREDSLYLSLSPGLGIEAARMLVTPDSFFVYDRLKKQLHYGSLTYAEVFLPTQFTGDDIFRNLLGLALPEPHVDWEVEADSVYYYLRDPDRPRHYVIDPTIWRVVRYEESTRAGDLLELRAYSEFDTIDDFYFARRVILQRPLDDTSISIYYRSMNLNPESLSLALRVSDSADRILVDDYEGITND